MLDNNKLNGKLECLVSSLNGELSQVYDTLAPLKECKVNLRAKQPWYDQHMKALKRKMRKYEKKWLKYKTRLSVGGLQEGKELILWFT